MRWVYQPSMGWSTERPLVSSFRMVTIRSRLLCRPLLGRLCRSVFYIYLHDAVRCSVKCYPLHLLEITFVKALPPSWCVHHLTTTSPATARATRRLCNPERKILVNGSTSCPRRAVLSALAADVAARGCSCGSRAEFPLLKMRERVRNPKRVHLRKTPTDDLDQKSRARAPSLHITSPSDVDAVTYFPPKSKPLVPSSRRGSPTGYTVGGSKMRHRKNYLWANNFRDPQTPGTTPWSSF